MGIETLIGKLLEYGSAPAMIVIAVLVGVLLRKLNENAEKDEKRAATLQDFVRSQIAALKKDFDERAAGSDKRMDELQARMSCVERDYLPREEHYKEFSGWRAEINRLYDLIVSVFKEMPKK